MKKILTYTIALLPVISIVSLLISVILIFPVTLIPDRALPVAPIWISELILIGVLILYKKRLNKFIGEGIIKNIYCIVLILSFLIFLKFEFIILFQSLLFIFYSIFFEPKFKEVKSFFRKSINTIAFLNCFDAVLISIYFVLSFNTKYIEMILNNFFVFFERFHLSQEISETIIIIITCLLFFLFLPLLRSFISVRIYKRQNNISVPPKKVLWNSYLGLCFGSFMTVLMYFSLFLEIDDLSLSTVLVLFMPMSMNIYFWMLAYESVNRGGDDKEAEISKWILIGAIIFTLFLLDKIGSDLLGIFTWFLPVLIPTFIGEVNYQKSLREDEHIPKSTIKMKTHLYWLQMVSFNTLVILNILSSFVTTRKIENNEIVEINILRNMIGNIVNNVFNESASSDFLSSILTSAISVLFSYLVAQCISQKIIERLKKYYLAPSKGYFE